MAPVEKKPSLSFHKKASNVLVKIWHQNVLIYIYFVYAWKNVMHAWGTVVPTSDNFHSSVL